MYLVPCVCAPATQANAQAGKRTDGRLWAFARLLRRRTARSTSLGLRLPSSRAQCGPTLINQMFQAVRRKAQYGYIGGVGGAFLIRI